MAIIADIFGSITLPILLLIAFGFFLERGLKLGSAALARMLVYAVLPCALFHFLSTAKLPLSTVAFTAVFTVCQFAAFFVLGWGLAVLLRVSPSLRPVFALAAAFPNSGNYGIPLIELALGPDWILHQSVITACHLVLVITACVFVLAEERVQIGSALKEAFRTPMLPAVGLGLLVKGLDIDVPDPVATPFRIMAGALTPLALMTLGAQVASTSLKNAALPVGGVVAFNLALAPLFTWVALQGFDVQPKLVELLVIGACAPVGLLLPILVAERGRDASFPAAVAVISTALSPFAATVVIALIRV